MKSPGRAIEPEQDARVLFYDAQHAGLLEAVEAKPERFRSGTARRDNPVREVGPVGFAPALPERESSDDDVGRDHDLREIPEGACPPPGGKYGVPSRARSITLPPFLRTVARCSAVSSFPVPPPMPMAGVNRSGHDACAIRNGASSPKLS